MWRSKLHVGVKSWSQDRLQVKLQSNAQIMYILVCLRLLRVYWTSCRVSTSCIISFKQFLEMPKLQKKTWWFRGFWVSTSSSFGRKKSHPWLKKSLPPNITGSPPERGARILPRLLDLLVSPAPQIVTMGWPIPIGTLLWNTVTVLFLEDLLEIHIKIISRSWHHVRVKEWGYLFLLLVRLSLSVYWVRSNSLCFSACLLGRFPRTWLPHSLRNVTVSIAWDTLIYSVYIQYTVYINLLYPPLDLYIITPSFAHTFGLPWYFARWSRMASVRIGQAQGSAGSRLLEVTWKHMIKHFSVIKVYAWSRGRLL